MPRADRFSLPVCAAAGLLAAAALFAPAPSPPAAVAAAPAPAAIPTAAPAAPADTATLEEVASVEGITEYRLSNGLRVLLFPDPSQASVTVNVTYFVGSRHEGYGEKGMAHLLEHMLFKGTDRHPDISRELTDHGARANGTTWYDRTNYYETFEPTDENLEWALDMEADRMVNSRIAAEDLESEMTVVRNEFEAGENSPGRVLRQKTMAAAFDFHSYGYPTIGTRSDIEGVPVERLRAFYRKYYQPDNAMLVVAGRFDEAKVLELVREKFGVLPRPDRSGENSLETQYTREPVQDGPREVRVRRVGDVQRLLAVYHVPAGSHPDFAAVDLLAHVLGDEPSGRLHGALVETGKAAGVGASAYQLHDPGVLLLSAEVRAEDSLEEARRAMLAAVDSLRDHPPTEEELERARNDRLRRFEQMQRDTERAAILLSEVAAAGDWRLGFLHRDRLEAATPEDLARVARAYLVPSNRTVGTFEPVDEPLRAEIPPRPDVDSMVADYRGREAVAAGEAFDPTPENLDARTVRREVAGGVEVGVLPKGTKGGRVLVDFAFRHGNPEALQGVSEAVAELTAEMLMRGTESRTRQEIRDALDRMRSSLNVGGDELIVSGSAETARDRLPELLRLLAEVLREPAFDPEEFRQLKEETLAELESQKTQPIPRASEALNRHLNPWPEGHPRATVPADEKIAQVEAATLKEVRAFHERFYGAAGGDLAVVGDADPDSVIALAEELFAGWEASVPYERVPDRHHEVKPTEIVIETPDRQNAMFLAGLNLPLGDDHPDYPALRVANFALGGGFLSSRLATRLRQQEGLSYAVGSQLSASPLDGAGGFVVYAIHAPQNRERVAAAVREELTRAVEEGFTEEEVTEAREAWLRQRRTNRSNDQFVASALESNLFLDRAFAWDGRLEERARALTAEEVNAALRRHVDPSRLTVVQAGDFSGTEGEPDEER